MPCKNGVGLKEAGRGDLKNHSGFFSRYFSSMEMQTESAPYICAKDFNLYIVKLFKIDLLRFAYNKIAHSTVK